MKTTELLEEMYDAINDVYYAHDEGTKSELRDAIYDVERLSALVITDSYCPNCNHKITIREAE